MKKMLLLATLALAHPASHGTALFTSDFSAYAGRGLAPGGVGDTLDSLRWTVDGLSDGSTRLGETRHGGDFARGRSPGGVTTGGLYAFEIAGTAAGVALGMQPTGSDLTPGAVALHVENTSMETVHALLIAFDLHVRNDGRRSTGMRVELGIGEVWTALDPLAFESPGQAAPAAGWRAIEFAAEWRDLHLAPGAPLAVRWLFDDASGQGARDEMAIDRIVLSGVPAAHVEPGPTVLTEPAPAPLLVAALAAAQGLGRRRRDGLRIGNTPATGE